jgi:hypothetical protein
LDRYDTSGIREEMHPHTWLGTLSLSCRKEEEGRRGEGEERKERDRDG